MKYSLPVFCVGEGDGRELGVADQAGEHRLRPLCCSETPEHARLLAIDHHVELGVVLLARDLHVGEQRLPVVVGERRAAWPRAAWRTRRRRFEVVAEDLDVDGRGASRS